MYFQLVFFITSESPKNGPLGRLSPLRFFFFDCQLTLH